MSSELSQTQTNPNPNPNPPTKPTQPLPPTEPTVAPKRHRRPRVHLEDLGFHPPLPPTHPTPTPKQHRRPLPRLAELGFYNPLPPSSNHHPPNPNPKSSKSRPLPNLPNKFPKHFHNPPPPSTTPLPIYHPYLIPNIHKHVNFHTHDPQPSDHDSSDDVAPPHNPISTRVSPSSNPDMDLESDSGNKGGGGGLDEGGLRKWLVGLGLQQYAPLFEIHEVDDKVLPHLTLDDLKDMGINAVGTRRKLFFAIQKLPKSSLS